MSAQVQAFFDKSTSTYSYIVHDGRDAAIIDPVWDFDHRSGRTHRASVEQLIGFIRDQHLTVAWILETHAHADHLSGAALLRETLGGTLGIGANIGIVQATFKQIFNLEPELAVNGAQFGHLFQDEERFQVGSLQAKVMSVPGHTPACVAYQIGDIVLVGDTMFMPDVGTARCDFPGGDARTLYRSIRRILDLPGDTQLLVCHDYPPSGRVAHYATTVAEQRASNIHVHDGISEEAFVGMRTARDRTLDMPLLIIPSIQVNIRGGQLPPAESNGKHYLKIPLNAW